MNRGFVIQKANAKEVFYQIEKIQEQGVQLDDIVIGESFNDFIKLVESGDNIVVYTYVDIFESLGDMLCKLSEFINRGIVMESVCEPAIYLSQEHIILMKQLGSLSSQFYKVKTKRGLSKARAKGVKLGRPLGALGKAKRENVKTHRERK